MSRVWNWVKLCLEKKMKKIAVAVLCVGLLGLSIFAQSGRTRPRVVVIDNQTTNQTNQNPNETNQNSPATTSTDGTKRPPVLIGDTKPTTTSTPPDDKGGVIQDDEVITVETNLVTLPVSVLDRDGRFITGLKQENFQIFEDGVQQKVEYFAPIEQPFTVVLLIDVSNSTEFKIEEIQNAAISFINQLRADDRIMVISFDEKIHVLSPPTNNRGALTNAIRQLNFGGGTSLYEAVDQAISRELKQIQGRKALVLFTDGVDTTSRRATYQSTVAESEEAESMIYPIRFDTYSDMNGGNGGGGNPTPRRGGGGSVWGQILGGILTGGNVQIGRGGGGTNASDYEKGKRYLEDLARTSGGRNFEARNSYSLEAAFAGIAEELRRQYAIGYYPETVGQTGQRKQIKVKVDRTNAVVRAKNSYVVGDNNAKNTAVKKATPTIKNNSRLPF
jgi:Ca-activated chloride channel homolog